jgi:hypothetical protein
MHKMRYVQHKISPPWLSPAAMEALHLAAAQRPHAASIKEQLIKQDKKGGSPSWDWTPRSKKGQ